MNLFLKKRQHLCVTDNWLVGHEAFQLEWLVGHVLQFLRHIFLTYKIDTVNMY